MARVTRLRFLGQVENHGDAVARALAPGDAVLVVRGRPRALILGCPCGCGDALSLNLDRRAGKAWLLFRRSGLTLYPSVWRHTACESHFVIWRNSVSWIGGDDFEAVHQDNDLANRILESIPTHDFVDPAWIAEQMDADPWDVALTCRSLARAKKLKEGEGDNQGRYRKA